MGEQTNLVGGGVGSRELVLEFSLSQQVCLNVGGILPRVERGKKKWRWRREGIIVWTMSLSSQDKMTSSDKWRGSLGWEHWQLTHITKEGCKVPKYRCKWVGWWSAQNIPFQLFLTLSAVTYLDDRTWEKLWEVWGKRKVWNNHEMGEKGMNSWNTENLRQRTYTIWYYNNGYRSLYVCSNPQSKPYCKLWTLDDGNVSV